MKLVYDENFFENNVWITKLWYTSCVLLDVLEFVTERNVYLIIWNFKYIVNVNIVYLNIYMHFYYSFRPNYQRTGNNKSRRSRQSSIKSSNISVSKPVDFENISPKNQINITENKLKLYFTSNIRLSATFNTRLAF